MSLDGKISELYWSTSPSVYLY